MTNDIDLIKIRCNILSYHLIPGLADFAIGFLCVDISHLYTEVHTAKRGHPTPPLPCSQSGKAFMTGGSVYSIPNLYGSRKRLTTTKAINLWCSLIKGEDELPVQSICKMILTYLIFYKFSLYKHNLTDLIFC